LRGFDSTLAISDQRKEITNAAVWSAYSALELLHSDESLTASINGMPLYKHALLTFCAALLLKTVSKWNDFLTIDPWQVISVVERLIELFTKARLSRRHVVWHIANGLTEAVQQVQADLGKLSESSVTEQNDFGLLNDDFIGDGFNFTSSRWMESMADDFLNA